MGGLAHLGLDIGGTGVKGMRLEADGQVSLRASRPTPQGQGAAAVLEVVRLVLEELLGPGPAASVGAGTPGAVDERGVVVAEAVNIPGWRGTDLGAACRAVAACPTAVRNDANLAGYAEWVVRQGGEGEGRVSRNLLFVGLGTGIGGGYVEDGRILGGTDDRAVELGHLVVHPGGRTCSCGIRGCVEAYAAGPAIAALARDLAPGHRSALADLARGPGAAAITAKEVYAAHARGDSLALAVHAQVVEALALGVAGGLALLAPDTVVLGGGVLAGAPTLVAEVAARVPEFVYGAAHRDCRFESALLGAEAGLLGAAFYGAAAVLDRPGLVALAGRLRADARGYQGRR